MLYEGSATVPFAHMADALSRLERFKELPEEVVGAMVADAEFVRRLRAAENDDDARSAIELKAGGIAADAMQRSKRLEEQLESNQHEIAALRESVSTLSKARDEVSRDRETVNAALADVEREATARIAAVEREAGERLEGERAAANADKEKVRKRGEQRQRWTAYLCLAGLVTAFTIIILVIQWSNLTGMRRGILLGWIPLIWTALLVIPKGADAAIAATCSAITIAVWIISTYQSWTQPAREAAPISANQPSQKSSVEPHVRPESAGHSKASGAKLH
jgi:bacterioferritin (cytochrome b1)